LEKNAISKGENDEVELLCIRTSMDPVQQCRAIESRTNLKFKYPFAPFPSSSSMNLVSARLYSF